MSAQGHVQGMAAEALAARWLQQRGLTVLTRNFRVRGGEIDLICHHGDTLVFVEVRLRQHSAFGGAAGSITAAKQRRIILAAQHYLAGSPARNCRFDCVLLNALDEANIEWIQGAFAAD